MEGEERLDEEHVAVMEMIRKDYPAAEDYAIIEDESASPAEDVFFNILDKNDQVLARVSEDYMNKILDAASAQVNDAG